MDADMDDVVSPNNNIPHDSDLDGGSDASSSDWGTPPPAVDNSAANEEAAASESEADGAVLGRRPRRAKARKAVVEEATHSSDSLSSLSDNDDDDDLYEPGQQADDSFDLEQQDDDLGHPEQRDEVLVNLGLRLKSVPLPNFHSSSASLFVAEDEADLVLVGETTLNRPTNLTRNLLTMDGLNRARAIKAEIQKNVAVLQPPTDAKSTRHLEEDPENELIKKLRQEHSMSWAAIAEHLNDERRERDEPATFTESACYSRFVRATTRVPLPVGEIGFDTKDYKHLRHPDKYVTAEGRGTGTISKAGKKRVKNFDDAKELAENVRKVVKSDNFDELETAEKTEQLMEAVAKVERNFWVLVADEMERTTTKLYPASALASRFHAI